MTCTSYASPIPPVSLASLHTKKCFATIRMLEYGVDGDLIDEYLQMSETICLDAMYKSCKSVIASLARFI
jgi:hypothetical protein